MKKFVEGLADAVLITPNHPDWAATSILVPKKKMVRTGWW